MKNLYNELKAICEEQFSGRKLVVGEGCTEPNLVLVGEAPGGEEEKQGRPFVGKAGKNLEEFLDILGLKRSDIYITNVVKLRPFKINPRTGRISNRPPNRQEVDFFTPYLKKELDILSPRYVVTLGNFALKAVSEDKNAVIGSVHGSEIPMPHFMLFPLYHPASIIYNPALKSVYTEDLKKLRTLLYS